MEDNSNEILTLLAKDELAAYMFNEPHNKDRYYPPEWNLDFDRGSTPSCTGDEETHFPNSSLKLTFDKMPKRVEFGYTFGRDQSKCDIYLPKRDISRVHFRITFSPEGRLLLIDTSSRGMWLSFNGQRNYTLRHNFIWIHTPDIKTIEADFGDNHSPRFELKVPRHTNIKTYQKNLKIFQKSSCDAGPSLGSLILSNYATAPWYLKEHDREGVLSHGQFGVVYKARDICTNELYAIKKFLAPQEDVAEKCWQKAIEILRSLPRHPHILRFFDWCDEGCLQLVMEYLPRGNLADEQKRQEITMEECVLLLRQRLQALVNLYSHGYTHRDIKPDNILVHSRTPLHIKLADFGRSQPNSVLFTFCETSHYLAPEVLLSQKCSYTPRVDVWAPGVVVYELAYGLPSGRNYDKPRRWANRFIDAATGYESDKLVDFHSTSILVMEHRRRLPAEECLKRASQLPTEASRMQTSLHQVDDHERSDCDFVDRLRARILARYDPPTIQKTSKPPNACSSQQRTPPTKPTTKPRRLNPTIPSVIITTDHIQMEVKGKIISMRRSDAYFNARQLLSLINESQSQEELLKAFGSIRGFKQEVLNGSDELWVPFTYGKGFCDYLDFETALKPLLDYGNGFIACYLDANIVMIRRAGFLINATHIYKVAKESQRCMQLKTKITINNGPSEYHGKYCSVSEGLQWCQSQRLFPLVTCLKRVLKDYGYKQHLGVAKA